MTTIPAALVRAADTFGDAEALVDADVRLSWAQLLAEVRGAARAYLADGVRPDEKAVFRSATARFRRIASAGVVRLERVRDADKKPE